MQRRRPGVVEWIRYCFGRRLPDDLRDWVLRDLTGRNSYVRHLIRGMVPLTPMYAAFLLFPGALWLRLAMVALALILALLFSAAYMEQNRARRLELHGLDPTILPARRQEARDRERQAYLETYRDE
ncbi:DUF5313 family protein [Williamsia sp. CHRR-6]|nr:DUF5313 family protein [Williamsia sp. CHRR-6]